MVRMLIASDWEKKARDTKAVNSEKFSSHRLHDDFHGPLGECRFAFFSQGFFNHD
jgi:hypothetical protein